MEDEKIEQVPKCLMSGLPSGHQIYESPHTQCQNFQLRKHYIQLYSFTAGLNIKA